MPYVILGTVLVLTGIWLLRTPRHSKIGVLLGSMTVYRVLGIIYVIFGVFAVLAGLGVESIGSYPVKVN
jgi:hypothetical protein